MTIFAVSLAIAMLLIGIGGKLLKNAWPRRQLAVLKESLIAFKASQTDEARQAILLKSGIVTLRFSLVIGVIVAVLSAVAMFPISFFNWDSATQEKYLLITSVTATVWWLVVRRIQSQKESMQDRQFSNGYSRLDRWLHWLALEPTAVRQLSFELERLYALPRPTEKFVNTARSDQPGDDPVYVCGMARSGTTMLLNLLDQAPELKSLNYRDMPFVLAPNLWQLISIHSNREIGLTERIHGDGVMVNYDSPEAFEEVFWRTFGGVTTNKTTGYGGPAPDQGTLSAFADYRGIIANPRHRQHGSNQPRRYLSKNNNNLMRIQELAADPTATLLLVYRDPVNTARSSYRLHQMLCTAKSDEFTSAYMKWLGHHEFGPNHAPFRFALPYMDRNLEPNNPDYWLDYWTAIHTHIFTEISAKFKLISYDALCRQPTEKLTAIAQAARINIDIKKTSTSISPKAKKSEYNPEFSSKLLKHSYYLYNEITNNYNNI
jgi:hypothetical protein